MKKIKALYITNLGLLDNLAQTQVLPYLEGLSKKGIDIHILSFEKKEYLEKKTVVECLIKRLSDARIDWSYLLYHRRWGNVRDVFNGFIKAYGIVRERDISILHARASIPAIIAWPLAKILKRKIIYDRRGTMAGDFVDDVDIKNIFSLGIFSRLLEAVDRFIIAHSDATIVLSEKALAALKNDRYLSDADKVFESIPCCADIPKFKDGIDRGNPALNLREVFAIAYVGSLGTCYLLEEMARFYKVLKSKIGNAIFLIISHTPKGYIELVLREKKMKPASDYVIINLRPDEVPQYLSQSKCSIMFIKPVACKIGSSPTKFGESLAAGVPVIVNKGIGDTEDIIRAKRVGVVVENFDEDSYEKALTQILGLLEEEGIRNRCIETANEFFSLDLGIERYASVYKKIIG